MSRFSKFHGTREQQLASLREQGWSIATIKTAPAVVAWHDERGKVAVKGWSFKADKPEFYYLFANQSAATDHVTKWAEGIKSIAEYRTKRDADRRAVRCSGVEAVYAKAAKEGYITCAETAVCLRAVLARTFPGVKFSVRSDQCINVSWTDGPSKKEVDAIAHNYAGEGFDGMIDMRHSISRWLSRDGSMSLAHDTGTEGSRGVHAEAIGSAHKPDAVLVHPHSDFVFCDRSMSEPVKRHLLCRVCGFFGVEMPELPDETAMERFINTTRVSDEWLSTLIHRASTGALQV